MKDAEREVNERTKRLMSIGGTKSADQLHRELGNVLWNDCGMARSKDSLTHALSVIPELREKFYKELRVTGSGSAQPAARAGRPRGRLLRARRAHATTRSSATSPCGGHFRVEYQTSDGEAQRNDAEYAYAAAWEEGRR